MVSTEAYDTLATYVRKTRSEGFFSVGNLKEQVPDQTFPGFDRLFSNLKVALERNRPESESPKQYLFRVLSIGILILLTQEEADQGISLESLTENQRNRGGIVLPTPETPATRFDLASNIAYEKAFLAYPSSKFIDTLRQPLTKRGYIVFDYLWQKALEKQSFGPSAAVTYEDLKKQLIKNGITRNNLYAFLTQKLIDPMNVSLRVVGVPLLIAIDENGFYLDFKNG